MPGWHVEFNNGIQEVRMDIFSELTAGITFQRFSKADKSKEATGRVEKSAGPCAPPTTGDRHVLSQDELALKDPEEAANLIRKKLRLHVRGYCVPRPIQGFEEIRLPPLLYKRLGALGFTAPTAVQAQVLPLLLGRRDTIAISPTGSGKTLAFLLPLVVDNLTQGEENGGGISSLILAPGRELAEQILRVLQSLSEGLGLHTALVTGASAAGHTFETVDVLISTPLRLCRLLNPKRKKVTLGKLRYLVLDETDKLLEESPENAKCSFAQQIDLIMAECTNPNLVISLYSATISETVERLACNVMRDPVRVTVGSRNATAHSVSQKLQYVGSEEGKSLMLQQLLQTGLKAPVLVFVATKEKALVLHRRLLADGFRVDSIFSDQDFGSRQAALESFRAGTTWVLISTDILARGIDFVRVETVVSYDCPESTADYVHRVGRTGRAGQEGTAITFFTEGDAGVVRPIANLIAESGQIVPAWMLAKSRNRDGRKRRRLRH